MKLTHLAFIILVFFAVGCSRGTGIQAANQNLQNRPLLDPTPLPTFIPASTATQSQTTSIPAVTEPAERSEYFDEYLAYLEALASLPAASTPVPAISCIQSDPNIQPLIQSVYSMVLGRFPSATEAETRCQELKRGVLSPPLLRIALAYSDEGAAVIDQIYQQVLARTVDAFGLQNYRNELAYGTRTLLAVRRSIAKSLECREKLDSMYLALLSRHIDEPGWYAHTEGLASGQTLHNIEQTILSSEEYCHQHCQWD